MASLTEARAAIDDAFKLVAAFGVTVISIQPRQIDEGWVLEVETARPIHKEADAPTEVSGVPMIIHDHGLPPPRFPYSSLRRKRMLEPS